MSKTPLLACLLLLIFCLDTLINQFENLKFLNAQLNKGVTNIIFFRRLPFITRSYRRAISFGFIDVALQSVAARRLRRSNGRGGRR